MVKLNVGRAEQIVRGVAGAALIIGAGIAGVSGMWRAVMIVAGSLAVFTASAGYCPLYQLLRLDAAADRDAAPPRAMR